MCTINANRADVQALPAEDRASLRAFAEKRLVRAESNHARVFWTSLIEACMPDDEWEPMIRARFDAYAEANRGIGA
ncbi:hypothetical protein D8770_08875 [Methylobacterium sp. DB1607]|nr:hypothetical protein [Methylobacterium sp. DB1607]